MNNQSTDTDADPQSTVGVGQVSPTGKALHEIQPSWLSDGFGIRGPQRPYESSIPARPEPMEFGIPTGKRASSDIPSSPPCTPTTPPESGTWFWGTVDGSCQWIDTTDCTPPP